MTQTGPVFASTALRMREVDVQRTTELELAAPRQIALLYNDGPVRLEFLSGQCLMWRRWRYEVHHGDWRHQGIQARSWPGHRQTRRAVSRCCVARLRQRQKDGGDAPPGSEDTFRSLMRSGRSGIRDRRNGRYDLTARGC